MAWESPLDPDGTPKAHLIAICEWVFLGIFTCEMTVKIIAYTFVCHREAYLHDPWCQLDFLVVTLAWLPILFPSMGNYSVLRAFRALRPLRALKRVPGMPMLVQWILTVLPKMGNVLMLCGFVFLVFGIVGMELFKGELHYRCALPGFVETLGHPESDIMRRRLLEEGGSSGGSGSILVSSNSSSSSGGSSAGGGAANSAHDMLSILASTVAPSLTFSMRRVLKGEHADVASSHAQEPFDTGVTCNLGHLDGPHAGCAAFPAGTSCAYFDANPNHGGTSFDSVGLVFISYMQMTTFDDWANPMYMLMAAMSEYVWVYFVLIVMIAGFFVVNL